MNNFLITTTNTIENAKITNYLGIVSSNIVLGTNVFSDFTASFSDFFGGYSNTYQNKLQMIYSEAAKELTQKAQRLGANCILGLKMDFGEISGKGKSMFMVSAIGTAAKVAFPKDENNTKSDSLIIPSEKLIHEIKKITLTEKIQKGILLYEDEWDFLLNYPFSDIVEDLLNVYINVAKRSDNLQYSDSSQSLFLDYFPKYISRIDRQTSIDVLYSHICEAPHSIIRLINKNKLFDSKSIITLLKQGELAISIALLASDQDTYLPDDIKSLNEIISIFDSQPDKGRIEMVKGLLSKATEKYICPNGHKNDMERNYCCECAQNIKGFTFSDTEKIDMFKSKVQVLSNLFVQN